MHWWSTRNDHFILNIHNILVAWCDPNGFKNTFSSNIFVVNASGVTHQNWGATRNILHAKDFRKQKSCRVTQPLFENSVPSALIFAASNKNKCRNY
jgi:hypothetical protein